MFIHTVLDTNRITHVYPWLQTVALWVIVEQTVIEPHYGTVEAIWYHTTIFITLCDYENISRDSTKDGVKPTGPIV